MKINQKILSIPPYISTAWKNVLSLHIEPQDGQSLLIIGLVNGSTIEIPNLDRHSLEAIFAAHEKYLEHETSVPQKENPMPLNPLGPIPGNVSTTIMSIPLNLGLEGSMGNMLQHDPKAMDSPDLPKEVLEKISLLSKNIDFGGGDNMPKPEPHCNCMHCQIMRAMQNKQAEEMESVEEEVSEEDLRFRDWDIRQTEEKLYIVTNPLSAEEHYNVFLGNPVGCTCGQPNCEHIRAVLNS